jgi:hypothetical protein
MHMAAIEYLYYRSSSRSTLLWLLTNLVGWMVIRLLLSGDKDNEEIANIIGVCAGVGSLVLIPILNVQLAKPLEYPTRNGRFWRTLGTMTLVVVLTVVGLAVLTGGLGHWPCCLVVGLTCRWPGLPLFCCMPTGSFGPTTPSGPSTTTCPRPVPTRWPRHRPRPGKKLV